MINVVEEHKMMKIIGYSSSSAGPFTCQGKEYSPIPAMLSRRLTSLGKQAIHQLYVVCEGIGEQSIPWVVASRYGDTHRVERFLKCIAENELLSPTEFSMSVNNAIISSFFIATKNKCTNTFVSAGEQTLTHGLLEAYVYAKVHSQRVGYLYYDSCLPEIFSHGIEKQIENNSLAMILEPNMQSNTKESACNLRYESCVHKDCDIESMPSQIQALNNFIQCSEIKQSQIKMKCGHFYVERYI